MGVMHVRTKKIHAADKLNRNISFLESNHQHREYYFTADEEIEQYKYHFCITGAVQMMLMLPSA